jgi:hypothetical protein
LTQLRCCAATVWRFLPKLAIDTIHDITHDITCEVSLLSKASQRGAVMANNLFISYDLMSPGQKYDAVQNAIKQLGSWAKIHFSLFYVNSSYTAEQAAKHVKAAMDTNDKLIVIDTSSNNAYWYNLPDEVAQAIRANWYI